MEISVKKTLTILCILMIFCLSGCSNITKVDFNTTPTPTSNPDGATATTAPSTTDDKPSPTEKAGNSGTDVSPTETGKDVITPTPAATAAPTPTAAANPTATTAPVLGISADEAKRVLEKKIDIQTYTVAGGSKITIDGEEYYRFSVSDSNKTYEPDILVNAATTAVYYYMDGGLVDFEHFPMDNAELGSDEEDSKIDSDEAIDILLGIPQDMLGLAKPLTEYTLIPDSWETMILAKNCICINVYEKVDNDRMQLVALFYVSVDGDSIYKGEDEEFQLIY